MSKVNVTIQSGEPDQSDDKIWGVNLNTPVVLNETPVNVSQFAAAFCALFSSMCLFGSLVMAGPWCSCGRACILPTNVENSLAPMCYQTTQLEHGGRCDPTCRPGYNPSTTELVCSDQALQPSTVTCSIDPKNPPGQDSRGFSMRFGQGAQKFAEPVIGCDFEEGKTVTGECFNECRGSSRDQPSVYNVWAISGVKYPDGWKPPNNACCKNLYKSCAIVNANITARQFVALSDTEGICNIACVPLPPDEVRFAEDIGRDNEQQDDVGVFNTTEEDSGPGAEEEIANVTTIGEETEEEEVSTTTLAPAMERMFDRAKINWGKNDTENITTTRIPVNQSAYWENYEKDHANDPIPTAPPSSSVDSLSPNCFWGILFSPLCIFIFIIFVVSVMLFICLLCCLLQQSLKETWPSNSNEVPQQIFNKVREPVKGYKTKISVSGKYSMKDPISPLSAGSSPEPDSLTFMENTMMNTTQSMGGTRRSSAPVAFKGTRTSMNKFLSNPQEAAPPKSQVKSLPVMKDVAGVNRFDVRPSGLDVRRAQADQKKVRSQSAPEIERIQVKPAVNEPAHDAFAFMGGAQETELDCPKRCGLEKKHKDNTTCFMCQYEGVRFVPYKLTLECVEFYMCSACNYHLCSYCANEHYRVWHRKNRGTQPLLTNEK